MTESSVFVRLATTSGLNCSLLLLLYMFSTFSLVVHCDEESQPSDMAAMKIDAIVPDDVKLCLQVTIVKFFTVDFFKLSLRTS